MSRLSFAEYLDRAMKRMHTDSVKLQAETGVPASWTRNLKNGRIKGAPDEDRLGKIIQALGLDPITVWTYLGRMDKVADLRGQPLRPDLEPMPEWAVRLEGKVDALNELLGTILGEVTGSANGLVKLVAEVGKLAKEVDRRPRNTGDASAAPPRGGRRRSAPPRQSAGTK